MAGPPEPRICTATGLPTQVCADAFDTTEKKAKSEMTVQRNMDAPPSQNVIRYASEYYPPTMLSTFQKIEFVASKSGKVATSAIRNSDNSAISARWLLLTLRSEWIA